MNYKTVHPNEIFADLDGREIDYIKARANNKSNRQALIAANLSQGWLQNRDANELLRRAMLLKADVTYKAQLLLEASVEEAARVKTAGLKVRDEHIKQAAASEILDRMMGKPTQRTELTGKDGEAIKVDNARESIQRKLAGISTASDEG